MRGGRSIRAGPARSGKNASDAPGWRQVHGGAAESLGELFPQGLVVAGDEEALKRTTQKLLSEPMQQPLPNTFVLEQMQQQTLAVYRKLLSN